MTCTPASYPARTHARKHANTRTHTRTHTQHPGTARHTARRSRHARMSSARQGKRREHCYKHVRAKTAWGHVRHFSHFSHKQRSSSVEPQADYKQRRAENSVEPVDRSVYLSVSLSVSLSACLFVCGWKSVRMPASGWRTCLCLPGGDMGSTHSDHNVIAVINNNEYTPYIHHIHTELLAKLHARLHAKLHALFRSLTSAIYSGTPFRLSIPALYSGTPFRLSTPFRQSVEKSSPRCCMSGSKSCATS